MKFIFKYFGYETSKKVLQIKYSGNMQQTKRCLSAYIGNVAGRNFQKRTNRGKNFRNRNIQCLAYAVKVCHELIQEHYCFQSNNIIY